MSMTLEEAWQEEAYDQLVREVLDSHRDEIVGEFVSERMASYFKQHPDLVSPALFLLEEARRVIGVSASAGLVLAHAAIDVTLRNCILKPVVFGMVHNEETGSLIAELVVSNVKFAKLLFSVLEDRGLNLKTAKRKSSSIPLWEEMEKIRTLRNSVIHKGDSCKEDEATLALEIAAILIEKIYPRLRAQFAQV